MPLFSRNKKTVPSRELEKPQRGQKPQKNNKQNTSPNKVEKIICPYCLQSLDHDDPDSIVFAGEETDAVDPIFLAHIAKYEGLETIDFKNHSTEILKGSDPGARVVKDDHSPYPVSLRYSLDDGSIKAYGTRLCGKCHCVLPPSIERSPVYTLVLLGGSSSGKTMYIAALSEHFEREMHAMGLGHAELAPESKVVTENILKKQWEKSERKASSPTRQLFPTVFTITDHTRTDGRSIILSIQDFAGEGMRDTTYLLRHPIAEKLDGVLVFVDINQLDLLHNKVNIEALSTRTLASEFNSFTVEVRRFLKKAKAVAVVMSKIDILSMSVFHDTIANIKQTIAFTPKLHEWHKEGVSVSTICDVSDTIRGIFEEKGRSALNTLYKNLADEEDKVQKKRNELGRIEFFGVSTMRVSESELTDGAYINKFDEEVGVHRLLEPILFILAKWGVLKEIQ